MMTRLEPPLIVGDEDDLRRGSYVSGASMHDFLRRALSTGTQEGIIGLTKLTISSWKTTCRRPTRTMRRQI